ncbi:hypothetical protein [Photobacterium rosenbergii]|uniref:DUF2489 domain-containing protein n=1 Tax=Photobacterium rosenbergii TaxID=294936 RepID=A0ABU3ZFD1_9GAMM|nr:hypothetical protein [Photobacterium rosenbergii]MDV5168815.1 hypothetical protein [Photobacterium rosenbergii]
MDISDAASIISLVVAGLASLYSRWAWSEAKRANALSLHKHQKDIYDSFLELKMHMAQYSDTADISSVSKFYYPSRNAKFYYERSIFEDLEKYYNLCFHIADKNRTSVDATVRKDLMRKAAEAKELAKTLESRIIDVISVMNDS